MVTPSGSCLAGSPAAAALGASENGHYVSFGLDVPSVVPRLSFELISPPAGRVKGGPETGTQRFAMERRREFDRHPHLPVVHCVGDGVDGGSQLAYNSLVFSRGCASE